MSVVPLTLTISLCLVFTFIVFFLREHARGGIGGADRDSLLPLAEETPRLAPSREADGCGCRTGRRAPCAGCLRHDAESAR
jgi:hypothetical protein